jgi:hemerythrin superfamily protein
MKNVLDVLKKDHRKVEALFTQAEKTDDPSRRLILFEEIRVELEGHATAEESVLYPKAEMLMDTEEEALHSFEEHTEIRDLITHIQKTDATSEEWPKALRALKKEVMHHVKEEEQDLFPKVEELLTDKQLDDMATRVTKVERVTKELEKRKAG